MVFERKVVDPMCVAKEVMDVVRESRVYAPVGMRVWNLGYDGIKVTRRSILLLLTQAVFKMVRLF